MPHLVGYARTSLQTQRLDMQLDALHAAGVLPAHVFVDQLSGARTDRPGLEACLASLATGDTLIVWRLDRLARSLRHSIHLLESLQARQITLVILDGPFARTDPTTSEGKLLFALFAALAEFERDLIRDRVRAGITAARMRGKTWGRHPALSPDQQELAVAMHKQDIGVTRIAQTLGCARQTIYTLLAKEDTKHDG
jgi:DNA invertase Pin-like site-specific DNA recombinase